MMLISSCNSLQFELVEMGLYISMSSVYKENFVLSESWIEVILLTYIRNRSGPKTEPCGTPDKTRTERECFPFTTTCCSLSLR